VPPGPGPGPDWQAELKARDAERRKESERVIAYYKERERQKRELKEGKEAIAREVAERNRREGWPLSLP
jgi:hypothetical protein